MREKDIKEREKDIKERENYKKRKLDRTVYIYIKRERIS